MKYNPVIKKDECQPYNQETPSIFNLVIRNLKFNHIIRISNSKPCQQESQTSTLSSRILNFTLSSRILHILTLLLGTSNYTMSLGFSSFNHVIMNSQFQPYRQKIQFSPTIRKSNPIIKKEKCQPYNQEALRN